MTDQPDAIREHVAAFNAHDTARVLAGFAPDAVWATGADVFRGHAELATVFDDWLWGLQPALELRSLAGAGSSVAAELHEELTADGNVRGFDIAVFFTVVDGLITRAKVYREGTADLD